MRLLITRPQPAADATAARLEAMGHRVLVSPLLVPVAMAWTPPAQPPTALLLTSANAVRLSGAPADWRALPVFAVGSATATAARAAGFGDVRDAGGDVAAALKLAAEAGAASILHLAGADRTDAPLPHGLTVEVRIVYTATLEALTIDAVAALRGGTIDVVLLYSARTAAQFAVQMDNAGHDRSRVNLAAISPAVADAAGAGWAEIVVAAEPNEDSLFTATFAAAGRLCDKSRDQQG
jgi:uroporphyrinogen-III synthase